jgi:TonB family protein
MLHALIVCAMTAHAGEPQLAPARPAPAIESMTLEDLDNGLLMFKKGIWSMSAAAGNLRADHTGATLESDLAKYLLSDAILTRIEILRTRARAATPAGSNIIPAEIVAPLEEVMRSESCRLQAVTAYWQVRKGGAYHDDLVQKQIDRLPAAARATAAARLRALGEHINNLRTSLDTVIASCPVVASLQSGDLVSVLQKYNELRLQTLSAVLDNKSDPADFAVTKRTTPCPSPAVRDGTDDAKWRVISRKNVADFYPAEAVSYEVEGRVEVVVTYDATGCVVETAIKRSSGSDALDNAASAYGFGIVFQPAVVNGKPVGGSVVAPVVFELKDWPADNTELSSPSRS